MFPSAIKSQLSVALFIERRGGLVVYQGRPWHRRTPDGTTVPGSDNVSLEFTFGRFSSIKFVVITKRGTKGGPGWEHADLPLRGEISAEGEGTLVGPGGVKVECIGFGEAILSKDTGEVIGHRLLVASLPNQDLIKKLATPRQSKAPTKTEGYHTAEEAPTTQEEAPVIANTTEEDDIPF